MSAKYFVGLDIGGTTVKSMLIDADGAQVGDIQEIRSHVKEGYRKTFEQLDESLRLLSEANKVELNDIVGIGLDVPAPCNNGVIWGRANLSEDWVGTDICGEYSEQVGKPVYMTNDGNAAAFGEWLPSGSPGRPALRRSRNGSWWWSRPSGWHAV